jgi:hypothetical protein
MLFRPILRLMKMFMMEQQIFACATLDNKEAALTPF